MLFSMLVSLRLPFWFVFRFPSDPCFIHQFSCFLIRVLSLITSLCGIMCAVREFGGWGGSHGWHEGVLGFACEFKLAHDLMCQLDSWFRFLVRILILQGTGESIYADDTWVRYFNRGFHLTVYPTPYVQNGFVHFFCHGSTQFREYNQGLPSYHAVNRNNKQRKLFRW